jgi:hypothetical protein
MACSFPEHGVMIADFKVKNNSEFTMKDRLLMERRNSADPRNMQVLCQLSRPAIYRDHVIYWGKDVASYRTYALIGRAPSVLSENL